MLLTSQLQSSVQRTTVGLILRFGLLLLRCFSPYSSSISITSEKNQKNFVFLMFPVVKKWIIAMKWVNQTPKISTFQMFFGSSHSQMFFKIDVLKNFKILTGKHCDSQENTGKHLCQRPATLLKADSNACVFRVSVVKFLRKPILRNTLNKK